MKNTDSFPLPVYLGYDQVHRRYHFFLNVEGKYGRLLTYGGDYFYLNTWVNVPGLLDTATVVPEEINNELKAYLEGRLKYEFIKLRKNSRTATVTKVYADAQASGPLPNTGDGKIGGTVGRRGLRAHAGAVQPKECSTPLPRGRKAPAVVESPKLTLETPPKRTLKHKTPVAVKAAAPAQAPKAKGIVPVKPIELKVARKKRSCGTGQPRTPC